jgi:hypothetical protein
LLKRRWQRVSQGLRTIHVTQAKRALTLIGRLPESLQGDRAVQAGTPMTVKGKTPRGLAWSGCGVLIKWLPCQGPPVQLSGIA